MSRPLLLLALALVGCDSVQGGVDRRTAPPTASRARRGADTNDVVTVGEFRLRLDDCRLTFDGPASGAARFEFPSPCRFSRDRGGIVRVVRTGESSTVLVEGSRPAAQSTVASVKDCETYIRGVIVTSGEVRLSIQTQKVAQCLPSMWDETMFHAFAARTQPTQ